MSHPILLSTVASEWRVAIKWPSKQRLSRSRPRRIRRREEERDSSGGRPVEMSAEALERYHLFSQEKPLISSQNVSPHALSPYKKMSIGPPLRERHGPLSFAVVWLLGRRHSLSSLAPFFCCPAKMGDRPRPGHIYKLPRLTIISGSEISSF